MYAVIFTATINQLDAEYDKFASDLRALAQRNYGCLGFESFCTAERELAISYWPDVESIVQWKKDELHLQAQKLGKEKWYKDYQVKVCLVEYKYKSGS